MILHGWHMIQITHAWISKAWGFGYEISSINSFLSTKHVRSWHCVWKQSLYSTWSVVTMIFIVYFSFFLVLATVKQFMMQGFYLLKAQPIRCLFTGTMRKFDKKVSCFAILNSLKTWGKNLGIVLLGVLERININKFFILTEQFIQNVANPYKKN